MPGEVGVVQAARAVADRALRCRACGRPRRSARDRRRRSRSRSRPEDLARPARRHLGVAGMAEHRVELDARPRRGSCDVRSTIRIRSVANRSSASRMKSNSSVDRGQGRGQRGDRREPPVAGLDGEGRAVPEAWSRSSRRIVPAAPACGIARSRLDTRQAPLTRHVRQAYISHDDIPRHAITRDDMRSPALPTSTRRSAGRAGARWP